MEIILKLLLNKSELISIENNLIFLLFFNLK